VDWAGDDRTVAASLTISPADIPSRTTPSSAAFACEMLRLSEASQFSAAHALATTAANGWTILSQRDADSLAMAADRVARPIHSLAASSASLVRFLSSISMFTPTVLLIEKLPSSAMKRTHRLAKVHRELHQLVPTIIGRRTECGLFVPA
jgi:hypothetical protein